ncbi:Acetyl-/propionyl-coenzyme A carboxylase alpha chain [compost metagenome]
MDSGIREGDEVSPFYDPMLGKLIAWGETREEARARLLSMLADTAVGGVKTNLAFLQRVLAHPAFAAAELDTGFIGRYQDELLPAPAALPETFWQLAGEAWVQSVTRHVRADDAHSPWSARNGWRNVLPGETDLHLTCKGEQHVVRMRHVGGARLARLNGEWLEVVIDGKRHRHLALRRGETLFLEWNGEMLAIRRFDPIAEAEAAHSHHGGLEAPMNGSIVRILVEPGQRVEAGTALVVLEAMKMEHSIRAAHDGVVKSLYCSEGELVSEGTVLVELEELAEGGGNFSG